VWQRSQTEHQRVGTNPWSSIECASLVHAEDISLSKTTLSAILYQGKPFSIAYQLGQYVAYLANDNVSYNSIKSYLSAIQHLQIAHGMGDPGIAIMGKLEQVLKGIKVHQAKSKLGKRTVMVGRWEGKKSTQGNPYSDASVGASFLSSLILDMKCRLESYSPAPFLSPAKHCNRLVVFPPIYDEIPKLC